MHPSPTTLQLVLLGLLLLLSAVDGFQLLEPLKELGARPFFLLWLAYLPLALIYRQIVFTIAGLWFFLLLLAVAGAGFALNGHDMRDFAGKAPTFQFVAHGALFVAGFLPIALRLTRELSPADLRAAVAVAVVVQTALMLLDYSAILAGVRRPLEGVFLLTVDRLFPTGVFSEPSYAATFYAIMLPILLLRARVWTILAVSAVVGAVFLAGGVRSFFVVYAASLATAFAFRPGVRRLAIVAIPIVGMVVVGGSLYVALQLKLLDVEASLSSAYRLGNVYSYLMYALQHDLVVGQGFGGAHFIYRELDHPGFMYLSEEFRDNYAGTELRVNVFNLWVRLFVELGVLPTLLLLAGVVARLLNPGPSPEVKVLAVGCLVMSLAVDSYVYGLFTVALLLLYSGARTAQEDGDVIDLPGGPLEWDGALRGRQTIASEGT